MSTNAELRAAITALTDRLSIAIEQRDNRDYDIVDGPYGLEPSFVVYEAEQMLDAVNEIRAARGLAPATLDQVRRIESSASGHSDYGTKYTLGCAFLALGEGGPW